MKMIFRGPLRTFHCCEFHPFLRCLDNKVMENGLCQEHPTRLYERFNLIGNWPSLICDPFTNIFQGAFHEEYSWESDQSPF